MYLHSQWSRSHHQSLSTLWAGRTDSDSKGSGHSEELHQWVHLYSPRHWPTHHCHCPRLASQNLGRNKRLRLEKLSPICTCPNIELVYVFVIVQLVETVFFSSCFYSTHRHGRRVDRYAPTSLWVWGISGHPGPHDQQWGETQDWWYNSVLINNPLCSVFSHGILCSCMVCIYVTMAIFTWYVCNNHMILTPCVLYSHIVQYPIKATAMKTKEWVHVDLHIHQTLALIPKWSLPRFYCRPSIWLA